MAYVDDTAVACAGLKRYSAGDTEVKRVWVESGYRGSGIASEMMKLGQSVLQKN